MSAAVDTVLRVIEGFEGHAGLGYLASTHWVATREGARSQPRQRRPRSEREWTKRKGRIYSDDRIGDAAFLASFRLATGSSLGRRRPAVRSVRLLGRNCPTATTRVAAGRELTPRPNRMLWAGKPRLHPLNCCQTVGTSFAVTYTAKVAKTSATRAIAFRHVRLMRVRWICAGNRGRKHKSAAAVAQYRSTQAQTSTSFQTPSNESTRRTPSGQRLRMSRGNES